MVTILGIDHVAINVRNIDKSLEFYTKILGLKITQREPSKPGIEYFLDCGPSLVGIIQAKDFDQKHYFEDSGLGANHFSFRIHSSDFDPMIRELEDAGVKIEFAKKREKSWSLYFYDLDGNKLEMTSWPVEDKVSPDQIKRVIYDPKTRTWNSY